MMMRIFSALLAVFLEYAFPMAVVAIVAFVIMRMLRLFDGYIERHPALQERLYLFRVRVLGWLSYFRDRADERYQRQRRGDSIWRGK